MAMMYVALVALLFAAHIVRADPCAFFDVEVGEEYNIRPDPGSPIRVTDTYPKFSDQCALNSNADGCCTTDKKYMSIHTEILDNTKPMKGETKEALYIATFAAPANIAKYTTVYGFSIVEVKPRGYRYKICYKSIDPRSGEVSAEDLIAKDFVVNIKDKNHDDGASLIGENCQICPPKATFPRFSENGPKTFCGPAFMWDPFSERDSKARDCYPMVSPNLMAIYPRCLDKNGLAASVVRFRSYACQETSDTGYRVSGRAKLEGTTVHVDACFVGTGQ